MRDFLGYLLGILVLAAILLYAFNVTPMREVTSIVQRPLSSLLEPLSGPSGFLVSSWKGFEQGDRLRDDNLALRDRIGELEAEVAALQEVARENEHLREQLRLQNAEPSLQRTPAKVIASRDANTMLRSITIVPNGSETLREGFSVVTPAGLVGRIVQANSRSAKVMLITDTTSAVSAVDKETRAQGIVVGQRGPLLLMRYVPQEQPMRAGDMVITSGVGGIFPEGIPIGRILSISRRDVDLYQQALIEPVVAFDELERVLVITNYFPMKLE